MVAALSTAAAPSVRSRPLPRLGETGWTVILLVLAGAALRLPQLGNPIQHTDDQFYLAVGHALLGGELPYVDIWDRKPLGLFLIYAAVGLLGGGGIVEYQLVATLFAIATAIVIARIAGHYSNPRGALLAGICYLASLGMIGGGGGQSPVFYNLLTAGAALLTLGAIGAPAGRAFAVRAIPAMLLAGLAIFVKQTAVVEGCFFGLALLTALWRQSRSPARVAGYGLAFAACGIFPTLAALLAYVALGHGDEFWFATVVSILLKGPVGGWILLSGFILIAISLLPLGLFAAAGLRSLDWRSDGRAKALFLGGWLVAAALGFLMVPNFFDHYALPLLVPMCIAAAPLFGRERLGRAFAALAILWGAIFSAFPGVSLAAGARADFGRTAEVVRAHLGGGCLYVHEGPIHLYRATGACRLTRYLFPDHLNSEPEAEAIGADPETELQRILAARPKVIVTARRVMLAENRRTRAILDAELERSYREVDVVTIDLRGIPQELHIWALDGTASRP
jgi:hypothetical protein